MAPLRPMHLAVVLACCLVAVTAVLDAEVSEQFGTSLYQRIPAVSTVLPLDDPHLRETGNFVEQVHITAAGAKHVAINWVTPRNPNGTAPSTHHHHRRTLQAEPCSASKIESVVQLFTPATGPTSNDKKLLHSFKGSYTCYSTSSYQSGLLHLAVVGPLEHDTSYTFRCGDPALGWSQEYTFKTLPAVGRTSLPFRLGLVGDLGQTHHSLSTLQHLSESQPGLVINVGDLSYADGEQPRWDSFARLIEPYFSTMLHMSIEGNHEVESYQLVDPRTGKGVTSVKPQSSPNSLLSFDKHFLAYETRFYIPSSESGSDSRLYYSFDVAGIHVIMLGCYTNFGKESRQYKWLEADLAKIDRSVTPWVVVGMHAPWYNSNTAHQQEMAVMRHNMEHLLHKHRVDLVFTGHVHAYERSHRVYKEKHHRCAPMHIVIGDGGNREGLARDWEFPQPHWSAYRESSYGHGTLDVFNSTHAMWRWVRNHDHTPSPADKKWVIRDVERCFGKAQEDDWAEVEAAAQISY